MRQNGMPEQNCLAPLSIFLLLLILILLTTASSICRNVQPLRMSVGVLSDFFQDAFEARAWTPIPFGFGAPAVQKA